MTLPEPFAYPRQPHQRKHGPAGYRHYSRYREWLRDEWSFQCPYCLTRERWLSRSREWERDHFIAKKHRPDLALDYDNLVHSCAACNGVKSSKHLPDPCVVAYGDLVEVGGDGIIRPRVGRENEGHNLIEKMQLDDEGMNERRRWIFQQIKTVLKLGLDDVDGRALLKLCLGYPNNLPDLSQERPPGGNRRPQGIQQSYFELDKKPVGLAEYY